MTDSSTDRRTRILVIEDEPRIAQFLVKGLGRDGHEVLVAEDGEVGMFLVLQEAFDAVVLDLTLPRRSGLEVLRDLRHRHPDLPVIMLTGHDDPVARDRCLQAGATGFLAKPLVFEDLRQAVNRHVR